MKGLGSFRNGSRRITCPLCFGSFAGREVLFRCQDPRCPQKAVPDLVYQERIGRTAPPGHVFGLPLSVKGDTPQGAPCDACRKETRKRLCPLCHFDLAHDAGLVDDRVIAIIGGRGTGKSHYIVALVNRLEHEVGRNFNFGIHMVGDPTRERFENDFRAPLFDRRTVLAKTQSAQVDMKVKTPLVFRLTIEVGGRQRALDLSFFDTAGEDLRALDIMSTEARYITSAAAIIFLLDPLQMKAVRSQLPNEGLPMHDPVADPTNIVERLREFFEAESIVSPTEKVQVPIAFTLAKMDALFPIIEAGSLLRRPSEHFGTFVDSESLSVHNEIRSYLEAWAGPGFPGRVDKGFARYRYFGVSSLGRPPSPDGRVEAVSSLRIEEPFLWILHELELIKGTR